MSKRGEIVISRKELAGMNEYSCSLPTGVIIGKRWSRNIHFGSDMQAEWVIGEYYELPPGKDRDAQGHHLTGIRWYWAIDESRNVHRGDLRKPPPSTEKPPKNQFVVYPAHDV